LVFGGYKDEYIAKKFKNHRKKEFNNNLLRVFCTISFKLYKMGYIIENYLILENIRAIIDLRFEVSANNQFGFLKRLNLDYKKIFKGYLNEL
jgi:hypothetical protein